MSEQDILRYLFDLSNKDYSLMNGLIPLGSCTMKHTPVEAMDFTVLRLIFPDASV